MNTRMRDGMLSNGTCYKPTVVKWNTIACRNNTMRTSSITVYTILYNNIIMLLYYYNGVAGIIDTVVTIREPCLGLFAGFNPQ